MVLIACLLIVSIVGCVATTNLKHLYQFEEHRFDKGRRYSSNYFSIPVYVSMTTISSRINNIVPSFRTLLSGVIAPNRVYLFISREPYLLDEGIKEIPTSITKFASTNPISVVFTNNTGPHRKLLPLLSQKYDEDCILITFDDDLGKRSSRFLISNLLQYHEASQRTSVVAYRARRIGLCAKFPYRTLPYNMWSLISSYGSSEYFVLPTGTGGVLYRPSFFHRVVFDEYYRNLTHSADDISFRLATLAMGVPVVVACSNVIIKDSVFRHCGNSPVSYNVSNENFPISTVNCKKDYGKTMAFEQVECPTNVLEEAVADDERRRSRLSAKRSEPSLYAMNKNSLNDEQWRKAVQYLRQKEIFSFSNFSNLFLKTERQMLCDAHQPTNSICHNHC